VKIVGKHVLALVLILICYTGSIRAFDLPEEALRYMAEASADTCSICEKASLKKAFSLLDKTFVPGSVIATGPDCRFVKSSGEGANDLSLTCYPSEAFVSSLKDNWQPPRLVFTFYTREKHLVGISDKDLTDEGVIRAFTRAKPGTVFEGRIEVIRYPYGDGAAFNYFRESGRLQVHCRALELRPAE
jgi:hypothetical protein